MRTISVVIPTLNEQGYIGPLIASLSKQTYPIHEVFVVDSNSTDNTLAEITANQGSLNVRVIKVPLGIGLARNRGAQAATGNVVVFFDSDVELPPDFLEKNIEEFSSRGLDIACTHFKAQKGASLLDRMGTRIISGYHGLFQYSKKPMASGFCIFVTRQWHDKIGGFNETYRHSEDHDYAQRAVLMGAKFRYLKSSKFTLSSRRYGHDGYFKILGLYAYAEINRLFFNYKFAPRTKALYQFGMFKKHKK